MTGVVASNDGDARRAMTPARIGLGRAGGSLPTSAHLALRADHARARDAVDAAFDGDGLAAELAAAGMSAVALTSVAASRTEYVRRPDLGRRLSDDSAAALRRIAPVGCDLCIVLCDGLSPGAVQRGGAALAAAITSSRRLDGWSLGTVAVVTNGRVAVGDDIGAIVGAEIVVVLVGERPGLSVTESVGAYLTYSPRPGRTDAERNCVSNIHDRGLSIDAAARSVVDLLLRARTQSRTGVGLSGVDPVTLPPEPESHSTGP